MLTKEECLNLLLTECRYKFIDGRYKAINVSVVRLNENRILKDSITYHTSYLSEDSSDTERVWNFLYNTGDKTHYCKTCNKILKLSSFKMGYSLYCSSKCSANDPEIKEKKIKGFLSRIDSGCYFDSNENYIHCFDDVSLALNTYKGESILWYVLNDSLLQNSVAFYTLSFSKEKTLSERIWHIKNKHMREIEHTCLECGKITTFKDTVSGYHEFCSDNCSKGSKIVINRCKSTLKDRYGVENMSQIEGITELKRETTMRNHGVLNPGQSSIIREKGRANYESKTGYSHPNRDPKVQQKRRATKLEKYGNPTYMDITKRHETNLQRYGTISPQLTGKRNYSKVSQELFYNIHSQLPYELQQHTHFAQLNSELYKYDKNNSTGYLYDFAITTLKLLIEFDGDYWHNMPGAKERDEQKQKFAEEIGYKVIRVKEGEYYKNKQYITACCVKEINEQNKLCSV